MVLRSTQVTQGTWHRTFILTGSTAYTLFKDLDKKSLLSFYFTNTSHNTSFIISIGSPRFEIELTWSSLYYPTDSHRESLPEEAILHGSAHHQDLVEWLVMCLNIV